MTREELENGDKIIWVIDWAQPELFDEDEYKGTSNVSSQLRERFRDLLTHRFQLFDDDNGLYFMGRSTNQSCESAFEPLDWAMADSGCTDIQYWTNNKWESL